MAFVFWNTTGLKTDVNCLGIPTVIPAFSCDISFRVTVRIYDHFTAIRMGGL